MSAKSIYIVWAAFQRRAVSMEKAFGFDVVHLPTGGKSKFSKSISYLFRSIETFLLLVRRKPSSIWVQCPPNFILLLCLFYRVVFNRSACLIADCHNAALRSPWVDMPLSRWAINSCDIVLVHNEEVVVQALAKGLRRELVRVLEDAPAYMEKGKLVEKRAGDYILVPCSFHEDEPIDALLVSAHVMSDVDFIITGPKAKAEKLGYVGKAPPNVTFTGFVSEDAYDDLIFGAGVILGLTTMEGIQLSVAGEALGAGKALVLSDTFILRSLFSECAVFTANDADSLVVALSMAMARREELQMKSEAWSLHLYDEWQQKALGLRKEFNC